MKRYTMVLALFRRTAPWCATFLLPIHPSRAASLLCQIQFLSTVTWSLDKFDGSW